MRESISAIIETGREIFCILNKVITPSPPPVLPGEHRYKSINFFQVDPTNYDWLPRGLILEDKKSGDYISLRNLRFKNYFSFVHKWVFEIRIMDADSGVPPDFLNIIEPIAVNKSEKIIAGSLHRISDRKKQLNGEKIGFVHLLPPPEKDLWFQAIESIIDLVIGEEKKIVSPWRKDIDIPLDRDYRDKLEKKLTEMKTLQEEVLHLQEQIQLFDCYRDLLTETGKPLESVVQKVLNDIGIVTRETEKGFPADLINREVAIEITGVKGGIGVDSNKVTQTNRFIQNFRKHNEKVILIVNTYRDVAPNDRKGKMNFSPEMKDYLKALSISYITTHSLYELWKDVIQGKKKSQQVKEKILRIIGEVTS